MTVIRHICIGIFLWAASCSFALAQEVQQFQDWCGLGIGLSPSEFQSGKVTEGGTSFSTLNSQFPSYNFLKGELIAITRIVENSACVHTASPKQSGDINSGWVPLNRIEILTEAQSTRVLAWWRGIWRDGSSRIIIQMQDGKLVAKGSTWWQGRGPSPHFGEFDGTLLPDKTALKLNNDETDMPDTCQVRLIAVGDRAAVQDNGKCGGMNVSFTGFYSRARPKTPPHGK